jgi:hypothetical protein
MSKPKEGMTMKTTIHAYWYDTSKPADAKVYDELCERLTAQGLHCFETWGGGKGHYDLVRDIDGREIELETEHLFNDQWNTAPIEGITEQGYRVFDWAQDYPIDFSKHIKKGHYLDQTEEMREARRSTDACGYCGKQEPRGLYAFCPHCIGNVYLKESDIHLLRMRPIDQDKPRNSRALLTEAEQAQLLPLHREAQLKARTEADSKRLGEIRQKIENAYAKSTSNAKTERDGFIWLLDQGLGVGIVENCIFYAHTQTFSFGWRNPVSEEIKSRLLDILTEFPFAYEIKTQNETVKTRA